MQDRSCLSYLIECFEVVSKNRTVDGSIWISRFLLIVWLGRLCPQPLMLLASPLHSCRPKPSLSPQLRPPLLLYPISSIPPYPCPPLPPPYTITPLVSFSFSYFFRISRSPLFLSQPEYRTRLFPLFSASLHPLAPSLFLHPEPKNWIAEVMWGWITSHQGIIWLCMALRHAGKTHVKWHDGGNIAMSGHASHKGRWPGGNLQMFLRVMSYVQLWQNLPNPSPYQQGQWTGLEVSYISYHFSSVANIAYVTHL